MEARALWMRFLALFQRRQLDAELDSEIGLHLEMLEQEHRASGMSADNARWAARRELGNITQLQETHRDRRGFPLIETVWRDAWYGLRTLRRNPGFTAVAALSLALGIGANTAIFSFVDAILVRSLPVRNPESLVGINWRTKDRPTTHFPVVPGGVFMFYPDPAAGWIGANFPYPAFELLRAGNSVLSSVFAFSSVGSLNLTIRGESGLVNGQYVSGELFSGLGVVPAAGRLVDPADDRPAAPAVAVVSYALWKTRFGGNPEAIGHTVLINRVPFTILGVVPPGFYGPGLANSNSVADLYLPLHTVRLLSDTGRQNPMYFDNNYWWVEMMGRLRPGYGVQPAQAALAPLFHQFIESIATQNADRTNFPALFLKEHGVGEGIEVLRRQYSKPIYLLLSITSLILAIACANIANLLLARAAAREPEMAVRLTLGAGRPRLMCQLLIESLLLSVLGGALGVLFALWGIRSLTFLLANGKHGFTLHADLNWHVLGIAIGLSILTGLLVGLAPAVLATRQSGGRSQVPLVRAGLNRILVVPQIAIALLLVVTAGLFVRTLANLQALDIGFNRENVLVFTVNAKQAGYTGPALARIYGDLQTRIAGIPGVRAATASSHGMLSGLWSPARVHIPNNAENKSGLANVVGVAPSFFTTLQIPILLGREIDERDTEGANRAAVVSEAFANTNYPGLNPVGRRFQLVADQAPVSIEIVGVSRNARDGSLKRNDLPPSIYLPYTQDLGRIIGMVFEVRTQGDPLALANPIRQIVRQVDTGIPVSDLQTQSAQIDQTLSQERTFAALCTSFAILGLAIACVGLYGMMAYSVVQRRKEIGIRMALGAETRDVIWMVLQEAALLSVGGVALGLPAVYLVWRFIQSFMFGLKSTDPLSVWLGGVGILLASGLAAGLIPARQAARVDPMIALRHA